MEGQKQSHGAGIGLAGRSGMLIYIVQLCGL